MCAKESTIPVRSAAESGNITISRLLDAYDFSIHNRQSPHILRPSHLLAYSVFIYLLSLIPKQNKNKNFTNEWL